MTSDDGSSWEDILIENKDLLPNYQYYKKPPKQQIGCKRNYLCKKSNNPILVFMDDDDIYIPNHIINRIRPLINNTRIGIVGSKDMLLYFNNDHSFRWKTNMENKNIAEGTMAFRKPFWKKKQFHDNSQKAEGQLFIHEREDLVLHISCADIMVMCVHGDNTIDKNIFYNYLKEWKLDHTPEFLKERLIHYDTLF
jgi:hypothetical protein